MSVLCSVYSDQVNMNKLISQDLTQWHI